MIQERYHEDPSTLGKGPTIVFQHGLLGGWQVWKAQIEHFALFFDVIALNLPGFSDRGDEEALESIDAIALDRLHCWTRSASRDFRSLVTRSVGLPLSKSR